MTIQLKGLEPFARGGNRLCFIHPDDPSRCIKVRRPDFSLAQLRRKKNLIKRLRPLSSFDDNLEEHRVLSRLEEEKGEALYQHISRHYGFVDTDLGRGIESELIRDAPGPISVSLKQHIWEHGDSDSLQSALEDLKTYMRSLLVPTRELLSHNVVAQCDKDYVSRLVLIDGLGSPNPLPFHWLPEKQQRSKVEKRLARFDQRVASCLTKYRDGIAPSHVGMILHR